MNSTCTSWCSKVEGKKALIRTTWVKTRAPKHHNVQIFAVTSPSTESSSEEGSTLDTLEHQHGSKTDPADDQANVAYGEQYNSANSGAWPT
eukprot:scaffold209042_cov22-Tisochrysis_lutea.AAC.1